jgi:hypothetical protein
MVAIQTQNVAMMPTAAPSARLMPEADVGVAYSPNQLRRKNDNTLWTMTAATVHAAAPLRPAFWYLWCGGDCRSADPGIAKDPAHQRVQFPTQ